MNGREFDDAFDAGAEEGRQRAKEAEQINTLQQIFNRVSGRFDRSTFVVQQIVNRSDELQKFVITEAKSYAALQQSLSGPGGAFPEVDSITISDNKNGTFNITTGGQGLYSENSADEAVKALGRFHGRVTAQLKP